MTDEHKPNIEGPPRVEHPDMLLEEAEQLEKASTGLTALVGEKQ